MSELTAYIESSRELVEENLQDFLRSRFHDDQMELIAYMAMGGKRLRGIMALLVCEAVGGKIQDAGIASCAVELCQAASLVKDDVMDNDDTRRGRPSFWRKFGIGLALVTPDVLVPHAALLTQTYGPRALGSVVSAWAKLTQGQLQDYPKFRFQQVREEEYEKIVGLKTAPLFETSCELGIRASGKDHLINLGRQYGYNTGMAFQIFDDAADLLGHVGDPWESMSNGSDLPVSMQALKLKLGDQDLINKEDHDTILNLAHTYLQEAETAARAFPDSPRKELLIEFPRFCCDALLEEAQEELASKAKEHDESGTP